MTCWSALKLTTLAGAEKGLLTMLRGVEGTDGSGVRKGSLRTSSTSTPDTLRSRKKSGLGGLRGSRAERGSGATGRDDEEVDEFVEDAVGGGLRGMAGR